MTDVTELLHSARKAVESADHGKALRLLDEAARLGPDLFGLLLALPIFDALPEISTMVLPPAELYHISETMLQFG